MLITLKLIAQDAATVLGAISALATALSHLPLPVKAQAFFARLGLTTGKFSVEKAQ